jgi:hypothetical protein
VNWRRKHVRNVIHVVSGNLNPELPTDLDGLDSEMMMRNLTPGNASVIG